ncbi:MAG: dockerin type I repeat-containing protein, partial [Gemmatimonadota bacterium]
PDFVQSDVQIEDSDQMSPNGLLDPGETVQLVMTLRNEGDKDGENIRGILSTSDPDIDLIDHAADFGSISIGSHGSNGDDPFIVSANLRTYSGHQAQFTLYLESDSGMRDTQTFSLPVGVPSPSDPTGPDSYGYMAYDNGDWRYYDRPAYAWFEIDPEYGGSGTVLSFVDEPLPEQGDWADYYQGDTEVLDLPFTFRYYGGTYDEISVCSNGWLSMGATWMTDFRNWSLPAVLSPPNIIAPFWDDLYMGDGNVAFYYDASGHRFVVEWSRVYNDYDDAVETFEVILHDPAHYPTVTGDGEILFQYHEVSNSDYAWNFATVGIESPDKRGGVEYTYTGLYSPGARELEDGTAIRFTTGRLLPEGPYLNYYDLQMNDDGMGGSSGDGDGLVDAGERVALRLRLINFGEEEAQGVTAELGTSDASVTIESGVRSFPNIAPGDAAFGEEPYIVSIAGDCENGHIIEFALETHISGVPPAYTYLDLEVVAPTLVVADGSLTEVQGDGDDRPESGETWELVVTLENVGGGQAIDVWGIVSTDDEYLTIIEEAADFPDMAADSARTNESSPFVFSVGAGASYHPVSLELSLFANNDFYTTVLSGELVVGRPDLLLVDDDGGEGCEVYYMSALDGQGRSYEVYDRLAEGELSISVLGDYWGVIWFTGAERESTLTVSDQEGLREYCNAGGNLFVSGQNIASDLTGTSFLGEFLHAEFGADNSEVIWVEGVSGDPISGGYDLLSLASGDYGANNQDSPDEVVCVAGSTPVFTYYGTGDVAALRYTGEYRVVYYAFGFESVLEFYNVANAFAMRAEMLGRILHWFEVEPQIGDANEDGAINILDIVRVINIILAIEEDPTEYQVWTSDCTGDSQVNILDVVGIVNVILGVGTCAD